MSTYYYVTAKDNNSPRPTLLYYGGLVGAMFVTMSEHAHIFRDKNKAYRVADNLILALMDARGVRGVDIKVEEIKK